MQKQDTVQIFPKHLFWDMDYSKLDILKDKDIIIPRALYATTPETFDIDIEKLEKIYSKKDIVLTLQQTKELISNKVCNAVANRYQITPFYRFSL